MIGVSVATVLEWRAVLDYYNIDKTSCKNMIYGEYFLKNINDKEIIFYNCGTRKVCSSGATQYMIDNFNLDKIIVVGTCAGIDKKYNILDVIIPNLAVQYDCTVRELEPLIKKSFNVDLSDDISQITIPYKTGIIGSADKAVVMKHDYDIIKLNNITIADMESACIAYICKLNKVKCIILKGISDFPINNNNEQTYQKQQNTFLENAGQAIKKSADREVRYNPDGSIKYVKEFAYDEEGNLCLEEHRNSRGELKYFIEYEYYKTNQIKKYIRYDSQSQIEHSVEYAYDNLNRMVAQYKYDSKHNFISSSNYEYDKKSNLITK